MQGLSCYPKKPKQAQPPPTHTLIYHFTLTLHADVERGSPRYVERSSVFVVLFSCRDTDTGPQSEHETGEELRKQSDHRLLALTIQEQLFQTTCHLQTKENTQIIYVNGTAVSPQK